MTSHSMESVVAPSPAMAKQDERHSDGLDEHLVGLSDPASFEASQYRKVRYAVEAIPGKKVIAVTSAGAGDGKTTTAINLAGVLAHAPEGRILVVDLDLLTPSLGDRLGLAARSAGVVDLVFDSELRLEDVIQRHPRFRLSILPAGRALAVAYEVLKSRRLRQLLHEASQQFDYVVLDSPPLAPIPDSRLIADCVDALVLTVAANRTPRKLLEETLNLIDPKKLIGIVFNGEDRSQFTYYGYYSAYNNNGRRAGARESDK